MVMNLLSKLLGIGLMHEHDEDWVRDTIMAIKDPAHKQIAWDGYKSVFAEAYNLEPLEHKKMNKARLTANVRLRAFVEKSNQLTTR